MKARFLHVADLHLGYKQYNSIERYNDFARAFLAVVKVAIAEDVDFVILAGDLFQKRAIDALTLNQAMAGLKRLQEAKIPCIAVEGNHELAYYDDYLGWMEFLNHQGLLTLLSAPFEDGAIQLTEHTGQQGAYVEPVPGLRVYGLRYSGASTARAMEAYSDALAAHRSPSHHSQSDDYTLFVAHTGVEGVLSGEAGGLSHRQLSVLRPHVDYLALGHIHKPFEFDDWIYNPGSPETCSMTEAQWPDRGYYLVDVDTSQAPKHQATLHANPRRPFHRLSAKTDLLTSPEALYDFCGELLERKASDLSRNANSGGRRTPAALASPVVELQLTGILPFDRSDLDLKHLESLIESAFAPLHAQVRNLSRSTEFAIDEDAGLSRSELERQVVTELLQRDARFRDNSEQWAGLALSLKEMALNGTSSERILEELGEQLDTLFAHANS